MLQTTCVCVHHWCTWVWTQELAQWGQTDCRSISPGWQLSSVFHAVLCVAAGYCMSSMWACQHKGSLAVFRNSSHFSGWWCRCQLQMEQSKLHVCTHKAIYCFALCCLSAPISYPEIHSHSHSCTTITLVSPCTLFRRGPLCSCPPWWTLRDPLAKPQSTSPSPASNPPSIQTSQGKVPYR